MKGPNWDKTMERVRAQQFEYGARWPLSWGITSAQLKHAADHLYAVWQAGHLKFVSRVVEEVREPRGRNLEGEELEEFEDIQLLQSYFLLIGFAFENLLKGILMGKHPEYFDPAKGPQNINSHNLLALCERCELSIDDGDRDVLVKLTTYVEWKGRYPIPLKVDKMWPKELPDGTWEYDTVPVTGHDPQPVINALYDKAAIEFEELRGQLRNAAEQPSHSFPFSGVPASTPRRLLPSLSAGENS